MTEKILKAVEGVLKETYLYIGGNHDGSDLHTDSDKVADTASAFREHALKGVRKALEPFLVPGHPCRPGEYALLSNGSVLPVIYITYTQDDVDVGCQNGIRVSMRGRGPYSCAGFYRTRLEALEAREHVLG